MFGGTSCTIYAGNFTWRGKLSEDVISSIRDAIEQPDSEGCVSLRPENGRGEVHVPYARIDALVVGL